MNAAALVFSIGLAAIAHPHPESTPSAGAEQGQEARQLDGVSPMQPQEPAADDAPRPYSWRYCRHNGRWWYWMPSDCRWKYWMKGGWHDYDCDTFWKDVRRDWTRSERALYGRLHPGSSRRRLAPKADNSIHRERVLPYYGTGDGWGTFID